MIDHQFRAFVQENVLSLDELSRMYSEYRIELCELFWRDLVRFLNSNIPVGYLSANGGKPFEQGYAAERTCGWKQNIGPSIGIEAERYIHILFGNCPRPEKLMHGGWQIERPWTGVYVWLDGKIAQEKKIFDAFINERSSTNSEDRDDNWQMWKVYWPLSIETVNIAEFHVSLTNDDRRAQHLEAIRNELINWVRVVEEILNQPL